MNNLIRSLFNIKVEQIESLETVETDKGMNVYISLRKTDDEFCPFCRKKLSGNGRVLKKINHKILADRNMTVFLRLRRLRCKDCDYSTYEKNPLAFNGFSNSILTVNQVMVDLHDPRLNYTMIAQKNNVNVNDVIKYLDSYVTIPHI